MNILFLLHLVSGFTEEENVLVLNGKNFQEALDTFPWLLVEFYAPWCGHCQQLVPEYSKAAAHLRTKEPSVALAKVDATQNPELAAEHGVQGYPTLKFFTSAEPIEFTGGRTAEEIVSWVARRTGPAVRSIGKSIELRGLIEKTRVAVVLFAGATTREAEVLESVARETEHLEFYLCSDPEALADYKVTAPTLLLFKDFDDKKNVFRGEFTREKLGRFIQLNRRPL